MDGNVVPFRRQMVLDLGNELLTPHDPHYRPMKKRGLRAKYKDLDAQRAKKDCRRDQHNRCGTFDCPYGGDASGLFGQVHHIDGDRSNDSPSNLILLCIGCHRFATEIQTMQRQKRLQQEIDFRNDRELEEAGLLEVKQVINAAVANIPRADDGPTPPPPWQK